MTSQRPRVNIYDYPEHLNPFYEGDNHNIIRFKNLRKIVRSNSINFQSVKDFKNTLTRSFRIKSRRGSISSNQSEEYTNSDVSKDVTYKETKLTNDQTIQSSTRNEDRIRNGEYKSTYSPRSHCMTNHNIHNANSTNEPIPPSRTNTFPRRKKRAPPPPPTSPTPTPTLNNDETSSTSGSISGSSTDVAQQEVVESSSQQEAVDDTKGTHDRSAKNDKDEKEINESITESKTSLASNEIADKADDHTTEDDDAADLLQMVQQLQKEVEKLTGDTNNNMLDPNCEHSN